MLALRLQRTGRKKIANYRVIAQEHRFQPTSGKVTAYLGHYNPHTKEAELDTDAIQEYLDNGARPSDAAAKLFKAQGIKLPDWVSVHEYEDKKVIREAKEKAKAKAEEAEQKAAAEAEDQSSEGEADSDTKDEKDSDKPDNDKADTADKDDSDTDDQEADSADTDEDEKADEAETTDDTDKDEAKKE